MRHVSHMLCLALGSSLLLAAPAAAFDAQFDRRQLVELSKSSPLRGPGGLSVRQLDGMKVYNLAGQRIGEVDEVLAMRGGGIVALAVDFEDRLADDDRIVPLERLRLVGKRLVTDLTPGEIRALPKWDD